jgi:predicted small lipoprotein YifL
MARVLQGRFFTAGLPRRVLHGRLSCVLVLSSVAIAACGKKGPPLAPLRLVPEAPIEVTLRRVDDKAVLKLTLPKKNANGPGAVELDHLEIYAVTAAPGAETPPNRELLTKKYVIGTISVKPPPAEDQQPDPNAAADTRPSGGDVVTFSEELTADNLAPALLPPVPKAGKKPPGAAAAAQAAPSPAAAPAVAYPIRIYGMRGISRAGHPGVPAERVQLPIVALPQPPVGLMAMFGADGVLIAWMPPVTDEPQLASMLPMLPIEMMLPATTGTSEATRMETMALIAALPAVPPDVMSNPFFSRAIAPATPVAAAGAAPKASAAPAKLTFNVYAADGDTPLNASPLPAGSFPHRSAEFGKPQCFAVRTVKTVANVALEGEPSPRICVTPRDIFPPAAPTGLNVVAGPGAVSLIWNANTEPDLAGYLVLRGEAPGDTLQPLTPAPIHETNYRDATVKPGVRYVYVVVAVDTATPPNTSARTARVEETAR